MLAILSIVGCQKSTARVADGRQVLYYVDPMHPAYTSTEPGIAPDCGMKLVPVYAPGGSNSEQQSPKSSEVATTSSLEPANNTPTVIALKTSGTGHLRVPGRVVIDDSRVFRVNVGVEGWVRETYDHSIGSHVRKDEKLAAFVSPELVAQENSYLVASDRSSVPVKEASRGRQNAADRLRNLGMSDVQIKELGESQKRPDTIYMVSPVDGFIVSRNVAVGQRFEKGAEFYRIADLRHVWIVADVSEADAWQFRPGANVVVVPAGGGGDVHARVSAALPQIDERSKTVRIRIDAENAGIHLRPEMAVNVELHSSTAEAVMIPETAVLDSGLRRTVFVEQENGTFAERDVDTGKHFGAQVEVTRGLRSGERVASSSAFMLDSETRRSGPASPLLRASGPRSQAHRNETVKGRTKLENGFFASVASHD